MNIVYWGFLLTLTGCQGYLLVRPGKTTKFSPSSFVLTMAVDLVAEPDGGRELMPLEASMPGCRVKMMDELQDVKCDFGTPHEFWMTAEVDGSLIKEVRSQILKDASKKANFPGFRKGQIPPYAQPQITQFSIQESIIKTVQAIVDSYGLKELQGSDGKVEVKEDVTDMSKGYKVGDPIHFTATLNGALDPEKHATEADSTSTDVESGDS